MLWNSELKIKILNKIKPNNNFKENVRALLNIERVMEWCNTQDVNVIFQYGSENYLDKETNTILINYNMSPTNILSILLHELGHFVILNKNYTDRYVYAHNERKKKSLQYVIDTLDEEFEAWSEGWKLGEELGVLDENFKPSWNKIKHQNLNHYIKWAASN